MFHRTDFVLKYRISDEGNVYESLNQATLRHFLWFIRKHTKPGQQQD